VRNQGPTDMDELLWSPADGDCFERVYGPKRKIERISPIEHWFMAFSDTRNEIVHRGAPASLYYAQAGSAFEGHLLWVGEWVLRCAIRLKFQGLGFPGVWRNRIGRRWGRAMREAERMIKDS
jgi:hypothetical protein